MSPHQSRKLKSAALWLAILLAGLAAGWFGAQTRRAEILTRLADEARRSAVAIDPADLRRLAGTRADRETPTYAVVKDRLQKLAAVDLQVRFGYVFRFVPETGKVIFLGGLGRAGG
ncbi:MAG: hypothetical protein EXS43_11500 [Opitutus sp.]|nr:hypothetical protein [Opitutus sp.]